jgi:PAS domain S-box-containing protein
MHFVGMLAYQPRIPLRYDIPTVGASLLVAIAASALALSIAGRSSLPLRPLILGGLFTGLAIAGMHYIGMTAIRMTGQMSYRIWLVGLSVLIAMLASTAALWLAFVLRRERPRGHGWHPFWASLVMGAAISGMHYSGMAAVRVVESAQMPPPSDSAFAPGDLAMAITIPCLLMLAGALLLAFIEIESGARRRIEIALRESEEHYRLLFDETPRPICLIDAESHRFLAVNRAAIASYGYSLDQFLELRIDALADPSLEPGEETPLHGVTRHRTRQGAERVVEVVCHPLMFRGRSARMMVITDVTERERVNDELQVSRQQLDAMINNIPDMVWLKDTDLRYVALNEATLRSSGLRRDEVVGRTDRDLWPGELAERYMAQDQRALASGQRQTVEDAIPSASGTLAWVETISTPFCDAHGTPVGVAGIARDLTERRQLERQLLQSQKLEAIGSLAAGVAHEINTPTQYVGDNLRFLETAFAELAGLVGRYGEILGALGGGAVEQAREAERAVDLPYLRTEIPRALQQSLEGMGQVAAIVGAVKGFSHPGTEDKSLVDLNRTIENTVTVSRNEWKYVAELTTTLDPTLPLVPCYPGEIQQVLLNLIVNAAHAIGERQAQEPHTQGHIEISTRSRDGGVEIRVSDTGTGIPEAVRAKVFDPFFTTKGVGRGTGQGLAICHSVIVDKHDGMITFETEEGRGTTFIVGLPLSSEDRKAA